MHIDQFKQTVKFFNKVHNQNSNPIELWSANTVTNLPRIHKKDSIWKYENMLRGDKEKAVILIGASPSVKRDVELLKTLDDKFITIAANSVLKFLLSKGVKPDYVIALDGDPTNLVGHLDCDNKDLTLITSNATAPEAVDIWKGKVIWTPYYSIHKELKPKVRKKLGRTIPCGGNSLTAAAVLAYQVFDARMLILMGSEGCFDDRYYVDKESCWEKDETMRFRAIDSKGRQRYTNIPLNLYIQWFEKMAIDLPMVTMIDTSWGLLGTEKNSRIATMELAELIPRVKDAFVKAEAAKTDWRVREQIRYNAAYRTGHYLAKNGQMIWEQVFDLYDLSKIRTVLDVGCGLGTGVAMCRNEGIEAYGIDIAEPAAKYWDMANITKFCKVASADQIPFPDSMFDFVVCTEVMEHIPEEGVLDVLREIYRVGSNVFLFTVALKPARYKMPHDDSEPHICIKGVEWWTEKMVEAGFVCGQPSLAQSQSSFTILLMKGKEDGSKLSSSDLLLQRKQKVQSRRNKHDIQGGVGYSRKRNDSVPGVRSTRVAAG